MSWRHQAICSMKTPVTRTTLLAVAVAFALTAEAAPLITTVTQVNGRADRPAPQWTGQTFGLVNNSTTVVSNYTVPRFGEDVLAMTDRLHEYNGASTTLPLPGYLLNQEYVMTANNNRAQNPYQLNITVSAPVRAYLLVDNRVGDLSGAPATPNDPPNFATAAAWGWIATDNWQPMITGANRAGNATWPDEFGWDEAGDGVAVGPGNSLAQWGSIYYRDFPAGTFSAYAQNQGVDMYGLVITSIPEPASIGLFGFGLASLLASRRRR